MSAAAAVVGYDHAEQLAAVAQLLAVDAHDPVVGPEIGVRGRPVLEHGADEDTARFDSEGLFAAIDSTLTLAKTAPQIKTEGSAVRPSINPRSSRWENLAVPRTSCRASRTAPPPSWS